MTDPNWRREDFFKIDAATEHQVRMRLSQAMKCRYATSMQDKPFAHPVGGVPQYDPAIIEKMATTSGGDDFLSCTLNICLISWKPCGVLNEEYIMKGCEKYLATWYPDGRETLAIYIYIYIYIEREIHIYIHIYIYTFVHLAEYCTRNTA